MKKHMSVIIVAVIFVCGLSLFLYPTVSNLYNEYLNRKLVGDYIDSFSDIVPEEYEKQWSDAVEYNKNFSDASKLEELGLKYEDVLNIMGDGIMGYIEIPKISVSLVIYHTTDEALLQNGIGHVESSALPVGGTSTHCVLAGHTGLPSAKLLTNIDHLDIGDSFYIHILDETLEYRIDSVLVVEPHETQHLNVVSGEDYLTLVTCTPYGVNSHRLLVRGKRVTEGASTGTDYINVSNEITDIELVQLITFSLIGIGLIVFVVTRIRAVVKKRKKRKAVAQQSDEEN